MKNDGAEIEPRGDDGSPGAEDPKLLAKAAKTQREIAAIHAAITSCIYVTKRDRVAGLLNMFPECRDSDVSLTIRYWQTFQSEIDTSKEIAPQTLFKLERLTTIARLRAKIQNEYGLFPASEGIKRKRRKNEEEVRDDMLSDRAPPRLISIFADEAGKQDEFILIGSVWFLNPMKGAMFQHKVNKLRESRNIKNEFHFSRCGRQDVENYKAFVDLVCQEREFIGFKAIAAERRGSSRNIEEVLCDLYCLMALKGFEHEVASGRVDLPRRISLTLDEGGLTSIGSEMLRQKLLAFLNRTYGQNVTLDNVSELGSKSSAALQLADLITGVASRKLNHRGEHAFKDELADYATERLGLNFSDSIVNDDSFALIRI